MRSFWLLVMLCLLFPVNASAESYLCVPEAAATVVDGKEIPVAAGRADIAGERFLQVKVDGGKWMVKSHSNDTVLFDSCETEYLCECSSDWCGTFLRGADGNFSIVWLTGFDDLNFLNSAKGRCSMM